MSVGTVCSRETVICRSGESLATVAHLMTESHVGSVVVVDDRDGAVVPIAMVTDRDIVRALLKPGARLEQLTAIDAATRHPLVMRESDDIGSAIEAMLGRGVRRLPVVDRTGALIGILAVDDLIGYLSDQIRNLARLVGTQAERERA